MSEVKSAREVVEQLNYLSKPHIGVWGPEHEAKALHIIQSDRRAIIEKCKQRTMQECLSGSTTEIVYSILDSVLFEIEKEE